MRASRKYYFNKTIKGSLEDQLSNLKLFMIEHHRPFFMTLIDQQNFDYTPSKIDDNALRKEKVSAIKKLVEMQAKCLDRCIRTIGNREYLTELLYYLCKHGNYSCHEPIYTAEELSSGCISEAHGYMSCDHNLEKSLMLSLVFVKILLYNIFLKPEQMELFLKKSYDRKIIFSNLKLIGNIIYEIMIDVQDDLLEKAPDFYVVNNWEQYKTRFNLQTAASMTVKADFYQKNELISGLANHKSIR